VNCSIEIKVTSDDFDFHFHLGLEQFQTFLRNEVGVMVVESPDELDWTDSQIATYLWYMGNDKHDDSILSVHNVTVTNFTTSGIASQSDPIFQMDYTFFGGHHTFSCELPLEIFYNDFHGLYWKYLKALFSNAKEEPNRQ